MIAFTVNCKPKVLERHRDAAGGGKYDPSKKDKESFLAQCAQHRPSVPFDFPIKLIVRCFFLGSPGFYINVPDASNVLKFVEDALNGIFWADDRFIVDTQCIKMQGLPARVEVEIYDAEYPESF